ncbi:MAG: hypothetical protein V7L03_05370 [Nostoc sp.]
MFDKRLYPNGTKKDTALALTGSQPGGWEPVRASLWAFLSCHSTLPIAKMLNPRLNAVD